MVSRRKDLLARILRAVELLGLVRFILILGYLYILAVEVSKMLLTLLAADASNYLRVDNTDNLG
jgi:hypothetical protein